MNPFDFAQITGHSPKDILSYFSKAIPGFEGKISQAVTAGYSVEQVLEFLQKQFSGAKVDPKVKRQVGPLFQEEEMFGSRGALPDKPKSMAGDVGTLAAAGAGGLAGAALGGPAGAVQGAVAGATSVKDVLNSYEKHAAEGGTLGLADFLKAAAKGVGSSAVARGIYGLLSQMGEGEAAEEEELPVEQPQELPDEVISDKEPERDTKQAFDILDERGAGNLFRGLASQLEKPGQAEAALENLYGRKFLKSLEREHERPASEIINDAFEYVKEQRSETQPEEPMVDETQLAPEDAGQVSEERMEPRGHPDLQKYLSNIGNIKTAGESRKLSGKEIKALKSSNVRYVDYNPETKEMQALFLPAKGEKEGKMYRYPGVEEEDVKDVLKGAGVAVTTGDNWLRGWWTGKDPSIGNAFSSMIKKKYEGVPVEEVDVSNKEMLEVRDADKVFKTTQYLEAFQDIVTVGKARAGKEKLRNLDQALKELPDDILEEAFLEASKEIQAEIAAAKKEGKQKRYKGGRAATEKRKFIQKATEKIGAR